MNEHANPQPKEATTPARTMPPIVHQVLRSPGQPLDTATRHVVEPRFGHDFSRVRVHTDAQAAQSSRAVNALAYTVNSKVVFGMNRYSPDTPAGRRLLTHELAHVVQQEGARPATPETLELGDASDVAEKAADEAARVYGATKSDPKSSATLRVRNRLRASSLPRPAIQRAVKTWGGEFDTDKYESTKDPGMDGVDIELRFKPGTNVNAELIGMTQTARSLVKGSPLPTSMFGAAADKALKSRTIPSGETGAGTRVDRLHSRRIPLYGTDDPTTGDSLASGVATSTTQHGWRYTDKARKLQVQDALLKDRPQMPASLKETSQVFETTALAVKGTQTGTFYGSVQWGWEKDAAGTVKKLPLSLVSQGVPSATFGSASELWNKAKTSGGKETIDLPVVSVKVITGTSAQLFANPNDTQGLSMTPGTPLPAGTRFRVLRDVQFGWVNPVIYIEVVDGPLTDQRGYILDTVAYRDER